MITYPIGTKIYALKIHHNDLAKKTTVLWHGEVVIKKPLDIYDTYWGSYPANVNGLVDYRKLLPENSTYKDYHIIATSEAGRYKIDAGCTYAFFV